MLGRVAAVRLALVEGEGDLLPVAFGYFGALVVPGTGGDKDGGFLLAAAPAGAAELIYY